MVRDKYVCGKFKENIMSNIIVETAVYGDLSNGQNDASKVMDVTSILQTAIDKSNGVVVASNSTMGRDPCYGTVKKLAGTIKKGSEFRAFVCQEGQTINFNTL